MLAVNFEDFLMQVARYTDLNMTFLLSRHSYFIIHAGMVNRGRLYFVPLLRTVVLIWISPFCSTTCPRVILRLLP